MDTAEQLAVPGGAFKLRHRMTCLLQSRDGALLGDSLVYLIGAGLVGAGNFVLLPLYTRCLSPARFGLYSLLDVTILIVVTITQLGLGITYLKWFADTDSSLRGQLLGTAVAMSAISSLAGGATLFAAVRSLRLFATSGSQIPWLLMLLVPIEGIQLLLLADIRARRRTVFFCVAAAVRLGVMITAGIWFVRVQKMDVTGVLAGRLIGGIAGVILLGALSFPTAEWKVNPAMARGMLRYGLPLVWTGVVSVGIDASGRYLLARNTGLEQLAVYTLSLKISNVLQVGFLQPFGTAWNGMMFQIARDPDASVSVTRILSWAFIAGMTLAALISIFSPVMIPVFGNGIYTGAAKLVPWLLLPVTFRILEYWSSLGLYVGHRTGSVALVTSVGAVCNGLGVVLLVPRLGAFGAAYAWVIAVIAMIVAYAVLSRRFGRLTYNWRALLLGLSLWTAGALAARIIPADGSIRSVWMAAGGGIAITGPLLWYSARKLVMAGGQGA